MRRITEYQLIDLFTTRGTMPLGFDDVASGVGASPAEAIQGALDLLLGNGWDVNGLFARILADYERARVRRSSETTTTSYFVSVYVR
jgi:hypothetical protein